MSHGMEIAVFITGLVMMAVGGVSLRRNLVRDAGEKAAVYVHNRHVGLGISWAAIASGTLLAGFTCLALFWPTAPLWMWFVALSPTLAALAMILWSRRVGHQQDDAQALDDESWRVNQDGKMP